MNTWLFIWNPNRWGWDDTTNGYNELRQEIDQIGFAYLKWSCGVNKSICPGDRIFIIRLGTANRGIVASGYAASSVFEGIHWDETMRSDGKCVRRVYIRADRILDIDAGACLPYEQLQNIDPHYHWSSQASGVSIPQETAVKVEAYWKTMR